MRPHTRVTGVNTRVAGGEAAFLLWLVYWYRPPSILFALGPGGVAGEGTTARSTPGFTLAQGRCYGLLLDELGMTWTGRQAAMRARQVDEP